MYSFPMAAPTDGSATLWFRTYRYVEMTIETAAEPLTVDDFYGDFTGYPFKERGSFACDDARLADIWTVGWRTARLCAYETYFDCPYYEQMQYVGDTRIQSLVSLYVAGDDRLMRNAIAVRSLADPRGADPEPRPVLKPQIITTFSLFWIDMVHDYWMHRDDAAFIEAPADGHRDGPGLVREAPRREDRDAGRPAVLELCRLAGSMAVGQRKPGRCSPTARPKEARRSSPCNWPARWITPRSVRGLRQEGALADHYRELARGLKAATLRNCWDESRHLIADTPERKAFSQHANVLAVLSGCVEGEQARALMARVNTEPGLTQCTQYFRFYLLRAMKEVGLGDQYVSMLQPWHEMLARGLTTFAERPDPTRSDCHAWSASPLYEFLATVCGVEPASPGFKTVRIEPHLAT
jgi:alpha-L-rhamnosidase